MSLYVLFVATSATFLVLSALDYVRRAIRGETSPVPATWILMMAMMLLSLWMYLQSPKSSLASNIGVTAGVVNVGIILIGVMYTNIRQKRLRISFGRSQRTCLLSGVAIYLLWLITKKPLLSYTLVQLIAVAAYVATVQKLRKSKQSTEPIFLWVAALLGSLAAIYPAWVKHDVFACIYLARAIPSTIVILVLISKGRRFN